eukprot:TRINITY_DN43779_c0_g1_i6.p1 TRINITY_DN43779_c0_g1~~TRINITY_DN43779_c0_g1_i6.p1  ORF type:complete len:113 (-),score=8.63 TRINITY_DN43779_c0_g1_i6:79-417(-)
MVAVNDSLEQMARDRRRERMMVAAAKGGNGSAKPPNTGGPAPAAPAAPAAATAAPATGFGAGLKKTLLQIQQSYLVVEDPGGELVRDNSSTLEFDDSRYPETRGGGLGGFTP